MYRMTTIFLLILAIGSCGKYSRGDRYLANFEGDSLLYVVAVKGSGLKVSGYAANMKYEHESRGNSCVVLYLTDSASLNEKKSLLMMNSSLPNIEEDFLSKGYIGQFASKQIVSYLIVSYDDVEKYFLEIKDN
jgi:hypothetical protein